MWVFGLHFTATAADLVSCHIAPSYFCSDPFLTVLSSVCSAQLHVLPLYGAADHPPAICKYFKLWLFSFSEGLRHISTGIGGEGICVYIQHVYIVLFLLKVGQDTLDFNTVKLV